MHPDKMGLYLQKSGASFCLLNRRLHKDDAEILLHVLKGNAWWWEGCRLCNGLMNQQDIHVYRACKQWFWLWFSMSTKLLRLVHFEKKNLVWPQIVILLQLFNAYDDLASKKEAKTNPLKDIQKMSRPNTRMHFTRTCLRSCRSLTSQDDVLSAYWFLICYRLNCVVTKSIRISCPSIISKISRDLSWIALSPTVVFS